MCYRVEGCQLRIIYTASSTAATPLSLTNHAYFNLSAGADATVFDHTLQLACDAFAPDDGSGDGLPTGNFVSVEGTLRDLRREGKRLAQVIEDQARLSPHWPHGEEFVVTANRGLDWNAVAAACERGPQVWLCRPHLHSHAENRAQLACIVPIYIPYQPQLHEHLHAHISPSYMHILAPAALAHHP